MKELENLNLTGSILCFFALFCLFFVGGLVQYGDYSVPMIISRIITAFVQSGGIVLLGTMVYMGLKNTK